MTTVQTEFGLQDARSTAFDNICSLFCNSVDRRLDISSGYYRENTRINYSQVVRTINNQLLVNNTTLFSWKHCSCAAAVIGRSCSIENIFLGAFKVFDKKRICMIAFSVRFEIWCELFGVPESLKGLHYEGKVSKLVCLLLLVI